MPSPRELAPEFFEMLVESQYWSAQQMRAHQRNLLEPLLRHARAHVPFYEHRLDVIFARDGSIDWDRWAELPVLTRTELSEREGDMQARFLPPAAGRVGKSLSSGTTGVATRTSQTELSVEMSGAALARAFDWHGLDYSKTMVDFSVESPDRAMWPEGEHSGSWVPRWKRNLGSGQLFRINRVATPRQVLDFIMRREAHYVAGGTIRSQALAIEAERTGQRVRIDTILTRGAAVTAEAVELFGDVFGARAVGLYSSKEAHKMAHPCPDGECYHVNAELVLLEIVDPETGAPTPPGKTGKVLVTPFFNLAQPLVRYDIGDLAIAGETCTCGRTLPVLCSIVGREVHMFIIDGVRIVPSIPNSETAKLNAAMWQMAQVGPNEVEIRRVPRPGAGPADVDAITALVRQDLHSDMQVTFRDIERFELPASGKLVQYVREWSPG
jgi:phenylacetate-CoA ligase